MDGMQRIYGPGTQFDVHQGHHIFFKRFEVTDLFKDGSTFFKYMNEAGASEPYERHSHRTKQQDIQAAVACGAISVVGELPVDPVVETPPAEVPPVIPVSTEPVTPVIEPPAEPVTPPVDVAQGGESGGAGGGASFDDGLTASDPSLGQAVNIGEPATDVAPAPAADPAPVSDPVESAAVIDDTPDPAPVSDPEPVAAAAADEVITIDEATGNVESSPDANPAIDTSADASMGGDQG